MRRSRFLAVYFLIFQMLKITKYFHYEAVNRLWGMICCWQLGVLFSFLFGWGLASSLTNFGFCAVGF